MANTTQSVSFTNTPQAKADAYGFNEDQLSNTVLLDVTGNDLGGNAKKLYSIDDGSGALKDLLAKDPGLVTAWETTADGNLIRINAGKVEFSIASDKVNALTEGEQYSDTFVYAIQLGNGTLSYATVTVNILGQNDAATISSDTIGIAGDATPVVTEDSGAYVTAGKLSVVDADSGQSVFQALSAESLQGQYGSFSFDEKTGAWSYTLDNDKAQSLGADDSATETLTVTSFDGTASHTISVSVNGVNDVAVISGEAAAEVSEDSDNYVVTGKLAVADADDGESAFQAASAESLQGQYGSFSFDAQTGAWSYTLDNAKAQSLGADDSATETLTVTSLDGTATQTITATVQGVNDVAVISGDAAADVSEDSGAYVVTGKLAVADADNGQSVFQPASAESLQAQYGSFSFDAQTGEWTYTLDNAKAQSLGADDSATETLTVKSLDGSATQTITATVQGVNDVAVISGEAADDVTEDSGAYVVTGKLAVADADNGQSVFQAASAESLQGQYGNFSFDAQTGAWTYTLDNAKAQSLGADDAATETLTVTSLDGTATQTITATVNGVNDVAVISGEAAASVKEDSASYVVNGVLSVVDADQGQSAFQAASAESLQGQYGSFSFDEKTGAWSYTLDNAKAQSLGADDAATETLTVASLDGTATQTISTTVHGANDAAVISGNAAASVTEDSGAYVATGKLAVADADQGQSGFQAVGAESLKGQYGNFSFDEKTGEWSYTLDNAKAQSLATADAVDETLTVQSLDGTAKAITVTVQGADEPVVVQDTRAAAPAVYDGADPKDFDSIATAGKTVTSVGKTDNTIVGTDGDDVIDAKAGNDTVYGVNGDDSLVGGSGADTLYGGAGSDTIAGDEGRDAIYGGSGDDLINGGTDNDVIYGGSGNDTITGDVGNDTIVGGFGADTLTGGTGATKDVFKFLDAKDTGDTITDFHVGFDSLDFSAIDANTAASGDQAFGLVNSVALQANSINWFVEGDNTVVQFDNDGDVGSAEFEITLVGQLTLSAADFVL
ncbi:VCBS domain-containing protein [Rhodocyclus purpureus]|uniref:VCBS domain-containing protein n=1 Tax=Rhodocyclus purpureus TaxID=1067 RepID=UPI00191463BF|nr:VCBS domain-containing protein [Rhodocyclus purpureus]MBK5914194.1 hypothetical protein [Rhodocyclus purpureus]